ncbi:MAG: hypothetical protein ABSC13_10320 [Dehalococcoidia bacterium]
MMKATRTFASRGHRWLLAASLLAIASLTASCGHNAAVSQTPQPTEIGAPLPVTPEGPVEVYVMNRDGQPRLLTTLSSVPVWAWAPDDDHSALVTDAGPGSAEIHVISVNAGTETASANNVSFSKEFTWSPSGEWLAWESFNRQDTTTVFQAMRADGADRRQLVSNDATTWPEYGTIFGWRDGHTLLATVWEDPNSVLYEFDLASGTQREVATQPAASSAELSRDTSRVLYVAHEEPRDCSPKFASSLQTMDVSTGNVDQVLPPTCPRDCSPKFASSLQTMDVSTGNVDQVLPPTCGLSSASWSPDGSEIAYSVGDENARGTYILDLASGATRKLSSSSTLFDHVQLWSSDGSVVVVERTECPDGGDCPGPLHELVSIPVAGGDENSIPDALATFSPDGGAVAFEKDGLQVAQFPSGTPREKDGLQVAQFPSGTPREVMAADSDWRFSLLGWSLDGQWFAFARSPANAPTASPTP